eukprot:6201615-Pleurochrysis_carterae.AAC.2
MRVCHFFALLRVWNENGWLSVQSDDSFVGGMIDFAGAGVLHMTGGVISLAGATFVGPRNGRRNLPEILAW